MEGFGAIRESLRAGWNGLRADWVSEPAVRAQDSARRALEPAELKPDFFAPLALFPIANCDNMRLFCTLSEPEIISDLGAHLSKPFYCGGPPP